MTFLENPEFLSDYDPDSIPDPYSDYDGESEEEKVIDKKDENPYFEFSEEDETPSSDSFKVHPVKKMPKQNVRAKTIIKLLESKNGIPFGWESFFEDQWPLLQTISGNLKKRGDFFPHLTDVFRAFHLLPTKRIRHPRTREMIDVPDIRCVILGMDPYTTQQDGEPTAVGLSFSVRRGHRLNPSLQNIFKRLLETKNLSREPSTGDLTNWTAEGVFLLNAALTVPIPSRGEKVAGAHLDIWNGFLEKVIDFVCKYNPYCVFMLWGKKAQIIETRIKNTCKVLTCAHPAASSYGGRSKEPFSEMNHFTECNDFLRDLRKLKRPIFIQEINWNRINESEKERLKKKALKIKEKKRESSSEESSSKTVSKRKKKI